MLGRIHRLLQRAVSGRRPIRSHPETVLRDLAAATGIAIRDPALYARALRHKSVLRGSWRKTESNERLEFLGDAVLGLLVASFLYDEYPQSDEGFLTRMRSKLVNRAYLARCARRLQLGTFLEMSDNMHRAHGRDNESILSDAYEAIVGAVFLDRGLEAASDFVHRTMLQSADLGEIERRRDNFKSRLLELAQARGWPQPVYEVIGEEGPDHQKSFSVTAVVDGRRLGSGIAATKKQAEQLAAREALRHLEEDSG